MGTMMKSPVEDRIEGKSARRVLMASLIQIALFAMQVFLVWSEAVKIFHARGLGAMKYT